MHVTRYRPLRHRPLRTGLARAVAARWASTRRPADPPPTTPVAAAPVPSPPEPPTAPPRSGPHSLALTGSAPGKVDIAAPVVDTSQAFTVSAWVKLNNADGYQTAVSIDGASVSGLYLGLGLRGDTGSFAFARLGSDTTGTATVAPAGSGPTVGAWYHLVGVQDPTAGTISLYGDGALQSATGYTTPWKAAGHTRIGRALYGESAVDYLSGRSGCGFRPWNASRVGRGTRRSLQRCG